MKTNIFKFTAILLMLAGGFASCNGKENISKVYSTKEAKVDINGTEFVKMYFSPESGSVDSPVELILENHTKGTLTFGYDFSLEYFDNENWTEVQLNINFEAIGLLLEAGEIHKGKFDLSWIDKYNKGKSGKYRYVKNFSLSHDSSLERNSNFNLYMEFEIK